MAMSKITSITQARGIARLGFDDESSLSLRVKDLKRLGLSEGLSFDPERLRAEICRAQLDDAYEDALTRLDYAARSEKEILQALLRKGYLQEAAEAVVERLRDARLLNDRELAQRLTSAMEAGGRGKYAIQRKLRQRGIAAEASDEALDELSEEAQDASALKAARQLIRKYAALEPREAKNKLSQALSRRGFSWDSISYALEKISFSQED